MLPGWARPKTRLPYEVSMWGVIPYFPSVPVSILPCKPKISDLKAAIIYLEKKCDTHIPVSRDDGKKLPPRKTDYERALNNFAPPAFPEGVLMTVLSYYFAPTSFHLLSKRISSLVDTEEFYYKVCCNAGYNTVSGEYRKFFLQYIDISSLWRQAFDICKDKYIRICVDNSEKTTRTNIYVNHHTLTVGQARNIAMNLVWTKHNIKAPENPQDIIALQDSQNSKLGVVYFEKV